MNAAAFLAEVQRMLYQSNQVEHAEADLARLETDEMFLQIVRTYGASQGWTEHQIVIRQACVMSVAFKMLENALGMKLDRESASHIQRSESVAGEL